MTTLVLAAMVVLLALHIVRSAIDSARMAARLAAYSLQQFLVAAAAIAVLVVLMMVQWS